MPLPLPDPGLYRIHWRDGGNSLASIGVTESGGRWLAPTNWVAPAEFDWADVLKMDRLNEALESVGIPNPDFIIEEIHSELDNGRPEKARALFMGLKHSWSVGGPMPSEDGKNRLCEAMIRAEWDQ
jgi:hypothetical protein